MDNICGVITGPHRKKCTYPANRRIYFKWIPNQNTGRKLDQHDCCAGHVDTVIERGKRMDGWELVKVMVLEVNDA